MRRCDQKILALNPGPLGSALAESAGLPDFYNLIRSTSPCVSRSPAGPRRGDFGFRPHCPDCARLLGVPLSGVSSSRADVRRGLFYQNMIAPVTDGQIIYLRNVTRLYSHAARRPAATPKADQTPPLTCLRCHGGTIVPGASRVPELQIDLQLGCNRSRPWQHVT